MSDAGTSRAVRERLIDALQKELMGPSDSQEVISEFPTTRYIVGRLAPARENDADSDAAVEITENDSLGVGTGDDDDGEEDASPPLVIAFNPSSFGLSFLVDRTTSELTATVTWGDYKREKHQQTVAMWHRHPRKVVVEGIPISKPGTIARIVLSPSSERSTGVKVVGDDDPEITLDGVVHEFAAYRAISIFLVNRRTKGQLGDRDKDERWLYQPKLKISARDGSPCFVAKDIEFHANSDDDGDTVANNLLYRHAREFASGHGVAVGWEKPPEHDQARTTSVFTEFIPEYEVPLLIAPASRAKNANLDMRALADADSPDLIESYLQPLASGYEQWISELQEASRSTEIQSNPQLRDAAQENIAKCAECLHRINAGLQLLKRDRHLFEAFRFANRVMWDQRIHSLWASDNRKRGEVAGSAQAFDLPRNRTWRPFQIGFILLNLVGVAVENSEDRRLVDLLWFPTGGGKTEAYLGLSALVLALRRLRGDRHGMHAGAGVSIIMRYTLRLLTVQQFQRAAALIAACETLRRSDEAKWGAEPFRVGVWVGRGTTPNTFAESKSAIEDLGDGKKPRHGSPVQLVSCPRCGSALVNDKGVPERNVYVADTARQRTLVWCPNAQCELSADRSNREGIPVVVVDDEIYRICPSLLVGTVDKFARLPFKGETSALFGLRNRYSPTYGHLTEAHGDSVGSRKIRDAVQVPRLLPPELIIQDELHLISGPLGTMVGLYEAAVDFASSAEGDDRSRLSSKIIASTATIRRAAQQTRQLYARKLSVFPPTGLSAQDSYFSLEQPIDASDETAGRLYVGVNAPGSSTKTLLVRVYSILLATAEAELQKKSTTADPYGTLVGYFNSLRALGGAKRLVEDDVKLTRLKYLSTQRGFPRRSISDPEELTSRLDSWRIPGLLKKLDNPFPRGASDWPVDVLLATNMISVGVDIDRLGLMVVTGQPKTTAEYIQATSRIGRKHPGLVVTMYNWLGARDLSHYERFASYHAALYKYVEAISVTPFSSRALDRGLHGVFAAMNRLLGSHMSDEPEARNFDPASPMTDEIIETLVQRAALLVGKSNSELVRTRLLSYRDHWAQLASDALRYSWLSDTHKPPNNSRVLLRTSGTENEGEWSAPGSLREVEPTAGFYLDEGD